MGGGEEVRAKHRGPSFFCTRQKILDFILETMASASRILSRGVRDREVEATKIEIKRVAEQS